MASAKQIAWRKKFARMSKAGKFKKSKKTSSKSDSKKNHKSSKSKVKLPNGQGVFLVSDMPNPKAFRKKYLVVGIKRIGSREALLAPKKQFDDFKVWGTAGESYSAGSSVISLTPGHRDFLFVLGSVRRDFWARKLFPGRAILNVFWLRLCCVRSTA